MTHMEQPSTTLTVRSAMPSDYDVCLSLDHSTSTDYVWQVALDDMDGAMSISFRPARLPRSMKVLYPRAGDALVDSWQLHAMFLVAQWGLDVVGYVNLREERSQEAAWVADLVVDRGFRMRGIGSALLRGARQWASEHNLRRLIVETQTKNYPAIRFLQKRGLSFAGYNHMYYPNQDIAVFFGQALY